MNLTIVITGEEDCFGMLVDIVIFARRAGTMRHCCRPFGSKKRMEFG
jgi:hypothetical protein